MRNTMQKTDQLGSVKAPKSNKHDDFFQSSFSKPFIVQPFLQHFVEPHLGGKFDYDSLELCDNTYITSELANYYSDRLWSIRFKGSKEKQYFLLLFEHKSYVPRRIHLQLLRYMVEDWTKQIENQLLALQEAKKLGEKKLPKIRIKVILPIVLYHGKNEWKVPKFEDMFGKVADYLKRFLPIFEFIVVDLSKYSDKAIMDTNAGLLVNALLLFRHSSDADYLSKNVKALTKGLDNYDEESDYWQYVLTIYFYFSKLLKGTDMEKTAVLERIPRKRTKDDFYSLYDLLTDKGAAKGSSLRDKRFVTNMWNEGMSPSVMIKLSELSIKEIKEIIKNHIGESVFQAIQAEVRKKKSVSDIAISAQVSETVVNRVIDLLQYKKPA
jgi:Putative transposase, YhgA-like